MNSKLATIKIAKHLKDYSPEYGARSGERFCNDLLRPEFKKALEARKKLSIDLSGLREWPSSFVNASFGQLAREFGPNKVLNHLAFKSTDNPVREEKVKYVIRNSGQDKALARG